MIRPMRAPLAVLLVSLATTAPAAAGGPMDYETDFCTRRSYGEAHMKAHPDQTVSGMSVFALKGWNISTGRDLPYSEPTVALTVTANGRLHDPQPLFCTDFDEDVPEARRAPRAHHCHTACGTGTLRLTVEGDTVTVKAFDFPANCDLPALDGGGDRTFVLKRAAMSECAVPKSWPRDEAGMAALRTKIRKAFGVE
jgi:hypothetical protein